MYKVQNQVSYTNRPCFKYIYVVLLRLNTAQLTKVKDNNTLMKNLK